MTHPRWAEEFAALDRPEVLDALVRVLGESEFLWEDYLHAQSDILVPMICDPAEWQNRPGLDALRESLDTTFAAAGTADERARVLRVFKDREIFRADIRAILGLSSGPRALSAELSDIAEVLLTAAFRVALDELTDEAPRLPDGRIVPSLLCALGKCGGRELGFASDLELMLIYEDPETDGTAGVGRHFDRIVARLRALIASRRGGTFEVDFRLRPYGKGGSPATALTTFRNYYQSSGPAWGYERQALVKLRTIAGDPELARAVETHRDQFVYGPDPFDLDGCRRMRRLQREQLVRPGTVNAKYSPGALVDVEYLVQALQIAHGHRDPAVQTPNTLAALAALGAGGWLKPEQVQTLREAYEFFRALVDALRMVHGHAKDLSVPDAHSEDFARLARRMRFSALYGLKTRLDDHLSAIRTLTDELPALLAADSI